MGKVKSSVAAAARERAREARASLDAKRAERDRLIDDATTAYFVAVEEAERAEADAEAARARQQAALERLVDTGEDNDTIVTLTQAPMTAVRAARRSLRQTPADQGDGATGGDVEPHRDSE